MKRSVNRAERLQRLEEALLFAEYTTPELAAKLNVSRQTIWRDLQDLSQLVLLAQNGNRFSIDRRHYVSHVRLSVAESLMLYLALRHQMRRLTHVPPSMISAAEKLVIALRHPISDELAVVLERLRDPLVAGQSSSAVWDQLIEGWYEGLAVRIVYHKFQADEPAEYEIHPYLFEPAVLSEGIYVIGYSATHEALRTFKVERITRATLTTLRFQRPADLSVHDLLQHAWGVWYGEQRTRVRLRFNNPAVARRVKETLWHPSQIIVDLPGGGIEWTVEVAGLIELVPWIRGWGPDVEVLEPPELRQRIADELLRAARLYITGEEESA